MFYRVSELSLCDVPLKDIAVLKQFRKLSKLTVTLKDNQSALSYEELFPNWEPKYSQTFGFVDGQSRNDLVLLELTKPTTP